MFKGSIRFNDDYNIEVTVNEKGEITTSNLAGGDSKETAPKKATAKKTTKTEG